MTPHVLPYQTGRRGTGAEPIEVSAPWRDKAHKVIQALCRRSYLAANQLSNGQLRKKHVPYTAPQEAQDLVRCLDYNDEETAKAMFVGNYTISKLDTAV